MGLAYGLRNFDFPEGAPATRHASLRLAQVGHHLGTAPAVLRAKRANEQRHRLAEERALLDCSPGGASCLSTVTASASIASERTKGVGQCFVRSVHQFRSGDGTTT